MYNISSIHVSTRCRYNNITNQRYMCTRYKELHDATTSYMVNRAKPKRTNIVHIPFVYFRLVPFAKSSTHILGESLPNGRNSTFKYLTLISFSTSVFVSVSNEEEVEEKKEQQWKKMWTVLDVTNAVKGSVVIGRLAVRQWGLSKTRKEKLSLQAIVKIENVTK